MDVSDSARLLDRLGFPLTLQWPGTKKQMFPDARPLNRDTVKRVVRTFRPYRGKVAVVGGAIFVTSVAFNLVADGLRDALDVRL